MTLIVMLFLSLSVVSFAKPMAVSDGQNVQIIITINEGEIVHAQTVLINGKNPNVRDFAKYMVEQHMRNNIELKSLATKKGIEKDDSAVAESLKSEGERMHTELKAMKLSALDKI